MTQDLRTLAQFFFEVGFGACWAEAYVQNGEQEPFPLTDALVERAWEIAGEAHDDPAEFAGKLALANTDASLLEVLKEAISVLRVAQLDYEYRASSDEIADPIRCRSKASRAAETVAAARAAIATALGGERA